MGYILKQRMIFDLKSKRILYIKDGKEERDGIEVIFRWDIYALWSSCIWIFCVYAPGCDGIMYMIKYDGVEKEIMCINQLLLWSPSLMLLIDIEYIWLGDDIAELFGGGSGSIFCCRFHCKTLSGFMVGCALEIWSQTQCRLKTGDMVQLKIFSGNMAVLM